uniref:Uncharacterized protein n=1 Tax=Moniliophthora roreri TaxID=221103 RepID=A0A0W0FGA9_MONRR
MQYPGSTHGSLVVEKVVTIPSLMRIHMDIRLKLLDVLGCSTEYQLKVDRTTKSHGISYRALNDLDRALDNTKTFHESLSWPDVLWALAHAGKVITWWHHDRDGKMTIVNAETGAKIWTLFIPSSHLTTAEAHRIQLLLAGSKDKLPKLEFRFMPPGMLHLVFTPVPSIFRGSSFWHLNSLHLTQWSRLIDSTDGDTMTNVEHSESVIYQSLVRMALGIPVMESFEIHRSSLICLYDMLINNILYLPLFKGDDEYPMPQQVQKKLNAIARKFGKNSKRGKKGKVAWTDRKLWERALQECIEEVKVSQNADLQSSSPHFGLALRVLEAILSSIGKKIPSHMQDKRRCSAMWVKEEMKFVTWYQAGPVIEIDRSALLRLFPVEYYENCRVVH